MWLNNSPKLHADFDPKKKDLSNQLSFKYIAERIISLVDWNLTRELTNFLFKKNPKQTEKNPTKQKSLRKHPNQMKNTELKTNQPSVSSDFFMFDQGNSSICLFILSSPLSSQQISANNIVYSEESHILYFYHF